jgi:hypothetical protein
MPGTAPDCWATTTTTSDFITISGRDFLCTGSTVGTDNLFDPVSPQSTEAEDLTSAPRRLLLLFTPGGGQGLGLWLDEPPPTSFVLLQRTFTLLLDRREPQSLSFSSGSKSELESTDVLLFLAASFSFTVSTKHWNKNKTQNT